MANAFEQAMHQGFSRAEIMKEMMEIHQRMNDLGCLECQHMRENSPVCACIISHPEWAKCDFMSKGGKQHGA